MQNGLADFKFKDLTSLLERCRTLFPSKAEAYLTAVGMAQLKSFEASSLKDYFVRQKEREKAGERGYSSESFSDYETRENMRLAY